MSAFEDIYQGWDSVLFELLTHTISKYKRKYFDGHFSLSVPPVSPRGVKFDKQANLDSTRPTVVFHAEWGINYLTQKSVENFNISLITPR